MLALYDDVQVEEHKLNRSRQLSSPDPSDRAWAAACVSNLIMAGSSVRKLLLSKGVIPLLLERLNDMQYEVLEESLGALRNLAAVEPSVAREYYNRDILTALGALLPKVRRRKKKGK